MSNFILKYFEIQSARTCNQPEEQNGQHEVPHFKVAKHVGEQNGAEYLVDVLVVVVIIVACCVGCRRVGNGCIGHVLLTLDVGLERDELLVELAPHQLVLETTYLRLECCWRLYV